MIIVLLRGRRRLRRAGVGGARRGGARARDTDGGDRLVLGGEVLQRPHHRADDVHRQREHDGRVLVRAQLQQGLEIAQLERTGGLAQHARRIAQLGGGLELTVRADHLRAPFALGLGLTGHCPLHQLGDLHVLDLDDGHLHTPRHRLLGDRAVEVLVEVRAVGQERVEVRAAHHGAQRGLGVLGGGDRVVLHLHDGAHGVCDLEHHHGVDAGGDVVTGDDLLGRDRQGDHAHVDPHGAVQIRQQEHQPGADRAAQPAQPEDDQALVLAHHAQRGDEHDEHEGGHDDAEEHAARHGCRSPFRRRRSGSGRGPAG